MRKWFQQKPWTFAGLGLFCIVMALWPWRNEVFALSPGCVFYRLTHLHCPGCGGTRCMRALSDGRVLTALRMNPLIFSALAWLGVFWLRGVLREWAVIARKPLVFPTSGGWWIAAVVLLFSVLRNLPWWPFCLLAPL